ncbi:NmrA-like family domain-containing oxidoreductase notO [Paramyrothecium foliicola]|nr:NmrA-like family domain-containing oxidoreductase notO [Paramyrothecium foliicola]
MSPVSRALFVGGTSGIGLAMASRVAAEAASATVIVSGRTKPSSLPHPNMEFRPLDASSVRAIKAYTDQYKAAQEPKLDLLVMSQGIFTLAGRTETPEGIDRKMALHFYGKQLLIRELLPAMADDAKVVIILDGAKGSPKAVDWDDLDLKKHYSLKRAADQCISLTDAMVQVHAAADGNRRHFIHALPGFVNTGVDKSLPWYLRPLGRVALAIGAMSPDQCAETMLRGTSEITSAADKEGRFWSNMDQKGQLIANKAIWTEEQRKLVSDHTWKIVDEAIAKPL